MSPAAVSAALVLTLLLLGPTDCLGVVAADNQTNYRLADDVRPVHYSLTLAPFIYTNDPSEFYFTGSVRISVRVVRSTSRFQLHSKQLFIQSLQVVDSATGRRLTVRSVEEDIVRQWQTVTLDEELKAGSNYTIVIDRFVGHLKPDLCGLYLASHTERGVRKYLVASQLEATDARKAFPCFDEPAMKATFDVSLVRRQDFRAMSNMPSRAVTVVSASDWFIGSALSSVKMVREDFETTPIMSNYLLAFVVSQFECLRDTDSKGRQYRICARPEILGDAKFGLRAAVQLNEFFEGFFGVANPLGQINQVAVPSFASWGMENWGLILYKELGFVYNSTWSMAVRHRKTATLISHEVAHQWFGNLVTMSWWNEIWLNEAFATFFGYLGAGKLLPDWDAQFVSEQLIPALAVDSSTRGHPVERSVESPLEIRLAFDGITYSKGGSIVRMMYNTLGTALFRVGLTNYLRNNSYSNTNGTALYQSLTRQTRYGGMHLDVGEVMDRWIKQMGYPVVSCHRHNHQLMLGQQHFLSNPRQASDPKHSSPFNYTWVIPITMVTQENASSLHSTFTSELVHWMWNTSQTFSISAAYSSWYLLNVRSTGFYRVNYDESNWDALTIQLFSNPDMFTPEDRARMLDDSSALAHAGYITQTIFLKMLGYLAKESHAAPWRTAVRAMMSVPSREPMRYRHMSGVNTAVALAYHIMKMKWPITAESGPLAGEAHGLLTSMACYLDVANCRADAGKMCRKFVASNFAAAAVPREARPAVFCICMVGGGGGASNSASNWKRFRMSRDAGELHWAMVAESRRVERTIAAGESVAHCLRQSLI